MAQSDAQAPRDLTLSDILSGNPVDRLEDVTPRFEENVFLQNLDALIAEQQLKQFNRRSKSLGSLKLTLSSRDILPDIRSGGFRAQSGGPSRDEDFFYLSDVREQDSPIGLTPKPDFSSLLAPDGGLRSIQENRSGVTGARVGLSLGNQVNADGSIDPGFLISVESAYGEAHDTLNWSDYGGFSEQVADRRYNLGVTVGYSGFNLDAALRREWSPLRADDSTGYDLGFSYQSNSWSARLGWSAYKAGEDLNGFTNEARDFVSVELGANLKLSDRIGLTGGLRYYAYEEWHIVNPGGGENSQMFFLGGRMRF